MIEKCCKRNSTAEHITCHKIDRERLGALRSLSVGCLYAADQTRVIGKIQVNIYRKVIAYAPLFAANLDNLIEVGYLVAGSNRYLS